MKTKVAIVGCGAISRVHVSALRRLPGIEIVAVCDRDRWRASELAALAGGVAAYADLDAILTEAHPDAVHILTPPTTHADLAVAALEAGCHALVEKPMALTAADADRMIAAARAHGVHLSANHNYLFKPSVARIRSLVAAGAIGRVVFVHVYYGLSGERGQYAADGGRTHWAWSLPGGAFTDFLPHVIYLQRAFLGEVAGVSGVALEGEASPGGPPTELTVLLRGAGASGVMTISMRAQPYAKFVDVFGTRGMVRADLVRETSTVQREQQMPRMLSKALFSLGESVQLVAGIAGSTLNVLSGRLPNYPGLHEIVRRFYVAIQEGVEPPTDGEDGRAVARVMEEIRERSPQPRAVTAAVPATPGPRSDVERRILKQRLPGPVLVTGASGFLGHRLIAALARCGAEVIGLARNPTLVSDNVRRQARIVAGDVRDRDAVRAAVRGTALVYHCAAVTTNSLPWLVHEETNVGGTRNVLIEAADAGVGRVVMASSVHVYGLRPPATNGPVRETSPYADSPPRWAYYMRSKLEADRLARELALERDLPVVILRIGILYGPGGGKPVHRDVLRIGSVHFSIGTGSNRLPFTYIDNAVDGCLLAAVSPAAAGREYNIVDEPQRPVRECARLAAKVEGSRFLALPVPVFLLSAAARLLEARQARSGSDVPPKLTRYVLQSASQDLRYDTTRAREELGWLPAVSLEEGLRRTWEAEGS